MILLNILILVNPNYTLYNNYYRVDVCYKKTILSSVETKKHKKNAEISAFFLSINGAGGSRTHVQTPANIFVYNHRLCIVLTAPRHITQA